MTKIIAQSSLKFESHISAIPKAVQQKMINTTWRAGCPVSINKLSYIRLSYWGFDKKAHTGELIIATKLAPEVVKIFKQIYDSRFPIDKMHLMSYYGGDDAAAMRDNNTSAFNCRANTTNPRLLSLHSYGIAIDINTRLNPYIKGKLVLPKNGKSYLNRKPLQAGMIDKTTSVYKAFIRYDWIWGGNFYDRMDYHHFQKRV